MESIDDYLAAAREAYTAGDEATARQLIQAAKELRDAQGAPPAPPAEGRGVVGRVADFAGDAVSVMSEVGKGIGAGAVGIPQGIAELGAAGIDVAFDTDTSRGTTEFFESAKERLGLDPTTATGKAVEGITNFGLAFIPVAGWLGRAGQAAKGIRVAGDAGRFTRSAEAFGAGVGKPLVSSRARLAATTSLAAGVSDLIVSPEGTGTFADAFDALPESLQTESDIGLQGRDEGLRRLRNKLRFGAEGAAVGAAFEAAFPALAFAGKAAAQVPGVPAAAALIADGMKYLGDQALRVPYVEKLLTSKGQVPSDLYENLDTITAIKDSATSVAQKNMEAFDAAAKKAVGGQMRAVFGMGGGRAGMQRAYSDLFDYLQGQGSALAAYGPDVVKSAERMRDQVQILSDDIAARVQSAPNLSPAQRSQILGVFQNNTNGYLRRLYKRWEDPTFTITPDVLRSPLYGRAVSEVETILTRQNQSRVRAGTAPVMSSQQLRADAEREVNRLLGVDVSAGLSPEAALKARTINAKKGQAEIRNNPRPLYALAEGFLVERSPFMTNSPSLRELLGEIKDPKQAYYRTIDDLARFTVTQDTYDRALRNYGVQGQAAIQEINNGGRPLVVVNDGTPGLEESLLSNGWKKLSETDADSIFGGSYGSLTGSYVAPEIYAALTTPQRMINGFVGEALALSLQAKGVSQATKVVYNPLSQVRNALSGIFLVGANGNIMRGLDMSESMRLTVGKVANLDDADFARAYNTLGALGLRDQNLSVNEFRRLLKEGSDLKVAGKTQEIMDKVGDRIPFANTMRDVYSGTDTYWKIVGWTAERAKYNAALRKGGITDPDAIADVLVRSGLGSRASDVSGKAGYLDTLAGDIVKKTMPTYSRVPEGVKALRRIPVTGNFMSFPAEMMRNTTNILYTGLRDLSFKASPELAQRIGDPALVKQLEKEVRAIGAQRLMSYAAAAYAVPQAVSLAAQDVLGYTPEEYEALQKVVPDYMRGHLLMPLTKPKNGNAEYVDLSYMIPHDFVSAPARAALQAYSQKGALTEDEVSKISAAAMAGLGSFLEPFAGEALLAERINDVTIRGGRMSTGREVYNKDAPMPDKVERSIVHVLGGFVPGAAELLFQERAGRVEKGRLLRAVEGVPSASGQEYATAEEAAALLTGLRSMKTDLQDTFKYSGYEYKDARNFAKSIFSSAMRRNDTTTEDIIRSYLDANQQAMRAQSKLYDQIQAAKTLGLSERDIVYNLRNEAGLGKEEIGMLLRGNFRPIRLTDDLISSVYQEVRRGQLRVTETVPTREIGELTRRLSRLKIKSYEILQREDAEREAAQQAAPVPAPQPPVTAAPAPVVPPAPTAPVAPPAPAGPRPSALLGGNPVDAAKNAEIQSRQ